MLKGEYKGYEIGYSNDFIKFEVSKEGIVVKQSLPTIEKVTEWIDNQLKVKYKRVKVLVEHMGYMSRKSGDPFTEAIATSIVEEGDSAWVVTEKEKGKKSLQYAFIDTPENRELIGEIREKEMAINTLNKEISDIRAKLVTLTPEMMVEEGKG